MPSPTHTYDSILTALPRTPPLLPRPTQTATHPHLSSAIASLELHPTLEALLHLMNSDLASAHFLVRHMQRPVPLSNTGETIESDGQDSGSVWAHDGGRASSSSATPPRHSNGDPTNGQTKATPPTPSSKSNPQPQAPRIEGMHLHGLLHRLEGDYDNAAAWYKDVASFSPLPTGASTSADTSSSGPEDRSSDDQNPTYAPSDSPATVFTHAYPEGLATPLDLLRRTAELRAGEAKYSHGESEEARAWRRERDRLQEISKVEVDRVREWLEGRYGTRQWREASGEFVGNEGKHKEIAAKMIVGGEGWRQF
ncbi:MAG: hypothetical protein M1828_007491 [Chrysothrix sp. TS-e1954]|nr:MAG: hypothetical protein M1828_007491 [Chrysothrix sp. TS-e1954]